MNTLAFLLQALQAIPPLLKAGADIAQFVKDTTAKVEVMQAEGRDPTPAEWDALNAIIATGREALHDD